MCHNKNPINEKHKKKSFQKKHKKMKCQLRKVVAKILSGLNQLIIITKKKGKKAYGDGNCLNICRFHVSSDRNDA